MGATTARTAGAVTLRPVTDEDREFLVGVYGSTREDELGLVAWPDGQREAFVRMQYDAQDTSYRAQNPDGRFDLVEVDGVAAGRMYFERRLSDIRLVDISLLPQFRGRGVGAHLITRLTDEAAATGRTVSVHVEIHNPAAGLYARLGFLVVAERGLYRRMEWSASGEGRFVPRPVGIRADRDQEEDEVVQLRMPDRVRALDQDRGNRAPEEKRELVSLLPLGPTSARLAARRHLDQLEGDLRPVAGRHVEALTDASGEVLRHEPLDSRHAPMLSVSVHHPGSPS